MMADKRISQLDELTSIDSADTLAIVDASVPQTKRTKISTLLSYIFTNTTVANLSDVDNAATPALNALLIGDGTEWNQGSIFSVLPSATGQGGKALALSSDASTLQWTSVINVTGSSTPDAGALVVGNGTNWVKGSVFSLLPATAEQGGKVLGLSASGTALEWVTGGGGGGGGADLTNYIANTYSITYTNLGVLPTSITLDITKRWNIGEFTGSATTHTINAISPTVSTLEPAHFTFVNNGSVTKTIVFNSSILSISGSTLSQVTLPTGYKIDFDVRRNPLNVGVSYEAKVGDVNYNQTASGLATTFNPSDVNPGITLSSGNTTAERTGAFSGTFYNVRCFGGKSSGKWRLAILCVNQVIDGTASSFYPVFSFGLADASLLLAPPINGAVGQTATSFGMMSRMASDFVSGAITGIATMKVSNNAYSLLQAALTPLSNIDGLLADLSTGKIWFTRNNTVLGGGNPEAGTGADFTLPLNTTLFPTFSFFETGGANTSSGTWKVLNEVEDPYINTWPSFLTWTA